MSKVYPQVVKNTTYSILYEEKEMIAPLRNYPKTELNNLNITYLWKPIENLVTNVYLNLNNEDKLDRNNEVTLQDWRNNMEKIRNKK